MLLFEKIEEFLEQNNEDIECYVNGTQVFKTLNSIAEVVLDEKLLGVSSIKLQFFLVTYKTITKDINVKLNDDDIIENLKMFIWSHDNSCTSVSDKMCNEYIDLVKKLFKRHSIKSNKTIKHKTLIKEFDVSDLLKEL